MANPVSEFYTELGAAFGRMWDMVVKPAMLHPATHAAAAGLWCVAGLVEAEPAYGVLAVPSVAAATLTQAVRTKHTRKHPQLLRTQKMVLAWADVNQHQVVLANQLKLGRLGRDRSSRDLQAEYRWEGQFIIAAGGRMRVDYSLEVPEGITLLRLREGHFWREKQLPTGEVVLLEQWGGSSFEVTPQGMDPELLEHFTFHSPPRCYCELGSNHTWKAHA